MTVVTSFPGVYLTESTNVPHVVVPATTNLTAFVGQFAKGPTGRAQLVGSWPEFVNVYGGLRSDSLASYGVFQFFANGGIGAWIVRLVAPAATTPTAPAASTATVGPLTIEANSPGGWADGLVVTLALQQMGPPNGQQLYATAIVTDAKAKVVEKLTALPAWSATSATDWAELATSIAEQSAVLTASAIADPKLDPEPPAGATKPPTAAPTPVTYTGTLDGGADPTMAASDFLTQVEAQLGTGDATPLLDKITPQVFNLLAIPDAALLPLEEQVTLYGKAIAYAKARQAFVVVDTPPPSAVKAALPDDAPMTPDTTFDTLGDGATGSMFAITMGPWAAGLLTEAGTAGAVYYPWVQILDPLDKQRPRFVPPSGTVAGLYAANDAATGGPWTAPAGTNLVLGGVTDLADDTIDDGVQGELNVMGINCLRTFPVYGRVVWGTRTLAGSDLADNPWKYVPVRRMANFIELSLKQSLKWAVFQPNNEPLWASMTQEVGAFMGGLFSQGAFGGTTAASAFRVTCDATTTSPLDQETGRVNIQVAFVPVYPAEFVVLNVELAAALPAAS